MQYKCYNRETLNVEMKFENCGLKVMSCELEEFRTKGRELRTINT